MKTGLFLVAVCIAMSSAMTATAQDYLGSEACTDCHTEEREAWMASHHAKAWTAPTPDNILADFEGTQFLHDGTKHQFHVENGRHVVDITEPDGSAQQLDVHSVIGIAPLQQYLLETEEGRLQSFDVVWDTEAGDWFHLYPDQSLPAGDGLHWTGPYKNWNARCAECHATGFEKNYDLRTRQYQSTQVEMGVGCESCHGPGSRHVDWATGNLAEVPPDYGFSMQFGQSTEDDIQQCAGCHSRRQAFGQGNPLPGTPFDDAYALAVLRPGLYHADGQIQDEVYVYGSFLQSKMYAKGVGCSNCHDPHLGEVVAEGNAVCTQCHSETGNPDFPSLKLAEYDTAAHHFHEQDTEGAQCKSCHMIERTYMGVDGRRDHSFRVPRPDLAAKTDAPNACTDCHSDQTAGWAAEQVARWYPDSKHRGPHYGEVLARGRRAPDLASTDLSELAQDQEMPDLVRATALFLLAGASTSEVSAEMAPLLADDSALVRTHAARLQRSAAPEMRFQRLEPLLSDPRRAVRIAAARELLSVPPAALTPAHGKALKSAIGEWQGTLRANLDFPETHLTMGSMAMSLRNPAAAERAFAEVVALDPQQTDAWVMLVRIADQTHGRTAAKSVLYRALAVNPGSAVLDQLVQQLWAEEN